MREKVVSVFCSILMLSALMIFTGCGGGGGGSASGGGGGDDVAALTVAEQVSVVEAQGSSNNASPMVSAMKLGPVNISPSDIPADSDYNNDRQEIYVHERSAESFNMINEILCAMAQSKYDEMVNKGDYRAQIDITQCSQDKDSASSAGESSQDQSSGSTAPEYEMWTVNSSRADNDSPHIVKVWMHEDAEHEMPAKAIFVKVEITEGKSDTNPYGIFTVNFKAHPEINGAVNTGITMFKGYLKTEVDTATNKVLLKFATEDTGGSFSEKAVLNREADGSSGTGSAFTSDSFGEQTEIKNFNIAFNSTHFLREDADSEEQKCFSRASFDETAWDYGLYDSNGSRVTRNSGFSIKKDNFYGWVGYYGLWLPEEAGVDNGTTVYRVTYGEGGETAVPYTVVKKEGRLKKHVRSTTTLGAIKNVPLDYWDMGSSSRVKWDGSNFVKFAQMNQETNMWENTQESTLDLSALSYGDLNFWSQSLGGQVRVKLDCVWTPGEGQNPGVYACQSPADGTQVIFFKEEVVFPGDTVPATLRCYDNCPKYTEAAGGVIPADPNYAPDFDPSDGTDFHNYTFNSSADDMLLKDGGNPLVWMDDESGQNQWGAMSGPLFEASDANLAALACDDWNQNGQADEGTCGWKAHSELSSFYTWETGANSWNQFTALKDAEGNVLEFEAPLQVQYTHSEEGHKYNGVSFYLEYSGFGNLHGIPGACIDMDSGEPTNCGPDTRWVPELTVADGSDCSDGENEYLIKALRKEQRMATVDLSECASLTATSYDLPSMDIWVDPEIGDEPTITNAPAVIGGVLQ